MQTRILSILLAVLLVTTFLTVRCDDGTDDEGIAVDRSSDDSPNESTGCGCGKTGRSSKMVDTEATPSIDQITDDEDLHKDDGTPADQSNDREQNQDTEEAIVEVEEEETGDESSLPDNDDSKLVLEKLKNKALKTIDSFFGLSEQSRTNDMVLVDSGTFVMGTDKVEKSTEMDGEGPARRVTISQAYFIDRHATSNSEFARFVKDTGYVTEVSLSQKYYIILSSFNKSM